MNYQRGPDLVKETEEYKRGEKTNWCTGCYRDWPLENFTTMVYKGNRRLISWCKSCVRRKMRPEEKAKVVLVNRQGMLHVRKAKGTRNLAADLAPELEK
jgi:hypothetical protein